jgi:predicted HAD superfamily Cof-like phosphohydrolase
MSTNWVEDIHKMHENYKMHERFESFTEEEKRLFLEFRANFLQEELDELKTNMNNPEEIVDALIDLCVVAIGTLDSFGIDAHLAWNEVLAANMNKRVGIKEGRPNPLGLPDLMKPEGWQPPNHFGNYGRLPCQGEQK